MLKNVCYSLSDLLGDEYIEKVALAQAFIQNQDAAKFLELAHRKVEFYPDSFASRADELALKSGEKICDAFDSKIKGAPTNSFGKAQHTSMSPISGLGCTRIGEDGRAYFIGKSEHYHASLGHQFPGYQLLDYAHQLGILNATHNNTRGYITRLTEREIVRIANQIARGDENALDAILNSPDERTLNRIINLETGSLAVEGGLKMMLSRFYRLDCLAVEPCYADKIPVFFVMADNDGGNQANYHGTTILTQVMRGMWPTLAAKLDAHNLYKVVPVKLNSNDDFDAKIAQYDNGQYKVAGIFHELVLMNYGGVRLSEEFVQHIHQVCVDRDIPVMVDEIQSCMWSPKQFLFIEYGITPDFVPLGKGFPGGQYPASKLLTNRKMDSLNQFGALVTNGQEELASLSYLITMRFVEDNQAHVAWAGDYYHTQALELAGKYPDILAKIEGHALLTTFVFKTPKDVIAFAKIMNDGGIDVSAQTYKANCPPVALTKLPLTVSKVMIDMVINRMENSLKNVAKSC
jgi:acetylornithine/succinyldiaminopimelate/putrescine aminotransferase